MNEANIDYETRSGTDIKLGLERYFGDPEADVHCLSYDIPNGPRGCWVAGEDPNPIALLEHVQRGGVVRGWNVMFEWHAWNKLCVRYGWPPLPLEQCVDTMAEAAAMNLPQSLDKCAQAAGLPLEKQKSHEGKLLIRKLCVPRKPTKHDASRWWTLETHRELHEKLHAYCDQDVVAEKALASKLRRLSPFEQNVWLVTQRINARGVPVDVEECANIVELVDHETNALNRELREVTGRALTKATQRAQLLDWVNARIETPVTLDEPYDDQGGEREYDEGIVLPDLQKDTVDKVLKREDLTPEVRRVLEIRRAVCQTSTAKYAKLLKIVATDETLKNLLVYHGAGTGRWASRGGFNVQNLFRPTFGKVDMAVLNDAIGALPHELASMLYGARLMEALASGLRGVLKAPEGFEFVDADYSSVENRVAAFIAGQEDKLQMFAEGKLDEYKLFATKLFGVPYEEVTAFQRQWCKPIILGGIFGLGALGLVAYADQYDVAMSLEEAEVAVRTMRAEYDMVKDCWYACGTASIQAVRNPGRWFNAGLLQLICHRGFLWMRLPSGRLISWARPEVKWAEAPWTERHYVGVDDAGNDVFEERPAMREVVFVESVETVTRRWCRHKLIGSSIFQSGVQGMARDILAHGVTTVEQERGDTYSVRALMHDEALSLVREGEGDPDEFGTLLCRPADWFADLPLAYEAWRGRRFKK